MIAALLEKVVTADTEIGVVLFADREQALEIARLDPVVRVGKEDVVALGVLNAEIARRGQAAVGLVKDADVVCAASLLVTDRTAAVGRAVVDQDDLKVAVSLAEHGVHRLGQILPRIVNR